MNWMTAYLENRVLSASPLELVNILYEHAILEVEQARESLARRDVGARSKSILKAIAIIGQLQASLDHAAGGEIAANLGKLYKYMIERLTIGNVQQSDGPLGEVARLLASLGEGWREIAEPVEHRGSAGWMNSPGEHIPAAEEALLATAGWSL
jgi:flagellar protein FliS